MKKIFVLNGIACMVLMLHANENSAAGNNSVADTPRMKQYWLVMLLKGSNRKYNKVAADSIQAAHIANIVRLAAEGKIVMAGPMGYKHDADLRGLFIMDAKDSATAASFVKTDPAVIAGSLRFELHPWWTQTGSYTFK